VWVVVVVVVVMVVVVLVVVVVVVVVVHYLCTTRKLPHVQSSYGCLVALPFSVITARSTRRVR
jgi:hypothetical protein